MAYDVVSEVLFQLVTGVFADAVRVVVFGVFATVTLKVLFELFGFCFSEHDSIHPGHLTGEFPLVMRCVDRDECEKKQVDDDVGVAVAFGDEDVVAAGPIVVVGVAPWAAVHDV